MKILIIESIAATPHLETAGEIALNLNKKNHDVTFAWIGHELPWNDWQLGIIAKIFGGSYEKKVKKFKKIISRKGIKIEKSNISIDLDKIYNWSKKFNGNLDELKNYKYDGSKLGAGVASSLISHFRKLDLNLDKNKNKVRDLLNASAIVYERTKKILKKNNPKKIYTFNNRFATCYPIICAAYKLKIKTIRHERGSDLYKYEIYEKDVHNLNYTKKKFLSYWKNNNDKKKIDKAVKYYNDKVKRKLKINGLNSIYTKNQIKNNLPTLPKDKRIVTFFTSRDYEKASIVNMEFNQFKEFKEFKKVVDKFKDIHLVVRVHPNLDDKISDDDHQWLKFKDDKTTIIKSYEKYDTYALMFKSDIVVTYTSSIIVESSFFGKPSISIGKFWWSGLKIVDEPKSNYELQSLLKKNYVFKKKKITNFLIIANYFLNFGNRYIFYKPITLTKGKFLGEILTWKSSLILFVEKIIKKII